MAAGIAFFKIIVAALVIAFTSWLSGRKPELAGFIVALPLASLLVLAFSYLEHRDAETTIIFAKSIMIAIPISLLFFVPFFFAEKFDYGFWTSYLSGLCLLAVGFFVHKGIVGIL